MHVKLNAKKLIEVNGKPTTFVEGDWVGDTLVGKQTLLRWLSDGSATLMQGVGSILPRGAGIVARGDETTSLNRFKTEVGILAEMGEYDLRFPRTCLWDTALPLRNELLIPGFNTLNSWQMVVPLCDYDILARDLGDEPEREYTASVMVGKDFADQYGVDKILCVPVYETRLMFIRRCDTATEFMECFANERARGGDDRLAFLRALFTVRPLILAAPYTWTTPGGYDKFVPNNYEH